MKEKQAIEWIHEQLNFGIKPGLKRVEWLLEKLNNPHKEIKSVHVAGTNGKGSTVTYLRHLFESHGFVVGTFTSPYIEIFNERVSINGQPIKGDDLAKYVEQIKPLAKQLANSDLGPPTEFEIITVIAMLYFKDQQVDYAIYEVGLGGRLDSTNVIEPILSIITTIGFDHVHILGETIEEITYEKAGIIKKNTPVVSGVKQSRAKQVIFDKAKETEASLFESSNHYQIEVNNSNKGVMFHLQTDLGINFHDVQLQMKGNHQAENAALALYSFLLICKIKEVNFQKEYATKSLYHASWPGRFELVNEKPHVILDGAHNVEAMEALIETINSHYDRNSVHIVLAVIKNKPLDKMLDLLELNFQNITITTFDFQQNYGYYELSEKLENRNINIEINWKKAINQHMKNLRENDVCIVTGSLYFVSTVREYFLPIR
ncbi:bifunctional folylpolyglutamate synthase/dihydrofolate synthase [Halalkalibacillus halophilus]|uniref:bifunctional folylpolyglutamate synthase/dihydrofolate synthase n=1 Tax=Halalkalibacillus halophilus TaxID=392827 RepID=UPI000415A768|nr:folylpolyglutamate synthase/dihydrofolate synthase family protein [Halalkalibacillus halophilus]